jgi:uracil-DNA glycosylase
MTRYIFVGERPSPRAAATGATWSNGRLAAKVLHDALRANGYDPDAAEYHNLWRTPGLGLTGLTAADRRHANALLRRLQDREQAEGVIIVALGAHAATALLAHGVPHRRLVHPAARGAIRKTARYQAHVGSVLGAADD